MPVRCLAETGRLLRFLLGDAQGRQAVRRIDDKIGQLPGLAGLGLLGTAAARYGLT